MRKYVWVFALLFGAGCNHPVIAATPHVVQQGHSVRPQFNGTSDVQAIAFGRAHATTSSCVLPNAPSPGNVLVFGVATYSSPTFGTITPPAGVTAIDNSKANQVNTFYRVVQPSDGTTWTFKDSQRSYFTVSCVEVAGANTTSPIDAHGTVNTDNKTVFTTPSLTPSQSGEIAIAFFGDAQTSSFSNLSSGYTSDGAYTGASMYMYEAHSKVLGTAPTSASVTLAKAGYGGAALAFIGGSAVNPTPGPTLPPFGTYYSLEPACCLTGGISPYNLEQADAAMVAMGVTYEINYNSWVGHLTGGNSYSAWLAYDAGLTPRMHQFISVKCVVNDTDGLNGTSTTPCLLSNPDSSLGADCPATTNAQVISCIYNAVKTSPSFAGWYIYDEPGCPSWNTIGYCDTNPLPNFQNINTVASYIASLDSTHPIIGIQTPSGVPGGCTHWSPCAAAQTQINNLYSCNGQTGCNGSYTWLTGSTTPNTGWDYYPLASATAFGSTAQFPSDIQYITADMGVTFANNYAPEKMYGAGQGFGWYQECNGGNPCTANCTTPSVCPFPSQNYMQWQRDESLYWARQAGYPVQVYFLYAFFDIDCEHAYTGCNLTANESAVQGALAAPFPLTAPTNGPSQ